MESTLLVIALIILIWILVGLCQEIWHHYYQGRCRFRIWDHLDRRYLNDKIVPLGSRAEFKIEYKSDRFLDRIWICDSMGRECNLVNLEITPLQSVDSCLVKVNCKLDEEMIQKGPFWLCGSWGQEKERLLQISVEPEGN